MAGSAAAARRTTSAASGEFVIMVHRIGNATSDFMGARVDLARQPGGGERFNPGADAGSPRAPYLDGMATREAGLPRVLRMFAGVTLVALLASVVFGDPAPGLTGEHLAVTAALAAFVAGLIICRPWSRMSDGRRILGLAVLASGCVALTGLQPDSGGYAGIYVVVVLAAARLPLRTAALVAGAALAGEVVV